jgi:hypothetical protein
VPKQSSILAVVDRLECLLNKKAVLDRHEHEEMTRCIKAVMAYCDEHPDTRAIKVYGRTVQDVLSTALEEMYPGSAYRVPPEDHMGAWRKTEMALNQLRGLLQSGPAGEDRRTAAHSPDFRCINWYGTEYTFTPNQAAIVKILWEAWENGTPDVGQETLRAQAEVESRIDRLFLGHAAWKNLIVPGKTRGTLRLQRPG